MERLGFTKRPKHTDGMAASVEPDQTAHFGGSALFAQVGLYQYVECMQICRALDKRKYLMIIFLISCQNHML